MTRVKLLLLVLVGALTISGCGFDVYKLPLPGGTDVGDDPVTVHIMFRDVLDLVPQSSVKVNDVSVGKVTDVRLDGFTADVTVQLRRGTELPDNAVASIRQTSLLGEKFVSLAAPESGASTEPLASGDVIPLERSGRNPEVEEVLGALSLLLNGGGVAQLRTIARELNIALEGREGTARSVLDQVRLLMTQLDDNKADIVNAIDKLNDLSVSINKQRDTIDAALEELPSALVSIDKQRDDLVTMLEALADLSDVGVRVIQASKAATIDSLQQLNPVLTQIAASGDDFVNAFHVFLTYPFVDEVVGRDPQVARNLHMGDYTNLSITLDLNIDTGITLPTGLPTGLPTLPTNLPTTLPTILDPTVIIGDVLACLQSGDLASPECQKVLAIAGEAARAARGVRQAGERGQGGLQAARAPARPADRRQLAAGPAADGHHPAAEPAHHPRPPARPGRRGAPAARLRQARPDDAAADGPLRPRPRQPARARNGRWRRDHPPHPHPARRLRADHPGRRQLRRGALRATGPHVRRHVVHRRRPLRGLRRHLRRRRGELPRRAGRSGREARAHRRRRRRVPRHRQRVRRHPGRRARRSSATARRWGSSTSSSSRSPTTSRT